VPLWRHLRRRSLAPRRPAAFKEQWPLVAVSAAVLVGSVVAVVLVVVGGR
jgi:hypothetical protein